MKVTYLQSASVIIEDNGVKILCDPWLIDGILYGSWAHYPPIEFNSDDFSDIDFIYISHIHQDHLDVQTLSKLDKNIPVLIHDFPEKFLKNNIERAGFKVQELAHNKRIHLKNDLYINILAADNCDPSICGKLFACNFNSSQFGTNQIDTLCVIDNTNQVIVNMNDCPFEIAHTIANKIKEIYNNVDLLLVGYAGASSYPGCYELDESEKAYAAKKKKLLRLTDAKKYVELFAPKFYLPFAGRFTLRGKIQDRLLHNGEPELEEAFDFLNSRIDQTQHKGFLLNPNESFDIFTGTTSKQYTRVNPLEKEKYIKNELSKFDLDYENEIIPKTDEILELIPACYARFEKRRIEYGFKSDTVILIDIGNDKFVSISCKGDGYKIISNESEQPKKFLKLSLDKRLLYWILQGPKKAHWNNADAGYHIMWTRIPNIYEMGIYYCLNYFHA
jgi:UDP-MurNAc hydroxylase